MNFIGLGRIIPFLDFLLKPIPTYRHLWALCILLSTAFMGTVFTLHLFNNPKELAASFCAWGFLFTITWFAIIESYTSEKKLEDLLPLLEEYRGNPSPQRIHQIRTELGMVLKPLGFSLPENPKEWEILGSTFVWTLESVIKNEIFVNGKDYRKFRELWTHMKGSQEFKENAESKRKLSI